ncbi:urease accessory protein UreF [Microcoleus sp. FACHB-1515]|uniref:urease accessory protein UreF n=1 Tax=Cyanophyceae TaxID=3028117 RepID=UPI00168660E8|nr:urease accessory protein UreF [Microcoleus sp. FACHB-1515]MBD2089032.1 urease accessory protein UreF [Microcoleus sp. FACHB-1515]
MTEPHLQLLQLLQLTSPALPVGAFSYSEGLETLVQLGTIANAASLQHWLIQELSYGQIRLEAAVMLRVYEASLVDSAHLSQWNHWLSAVRDSEELREQSWQMGRSLARLLIDLSPCVQPLIAACGEPCNYAAAFGIAAANWRIDRHTATLGYLHSWAANLVSAAVRLIPLGQTAGQRSMLELHPQIHQTAERILNLSDAELTACGWGLSIASMNHETLYSRLFRS